MDEKAQVSFEYLLTALFGIILAIAAAALIGAIKGISSTAQGKVLDYRDSTISALTQS